MRSWGKRWTCYVRDTALDAGGGSEMTEEQAVQMNKPEVAVTQAVDSSIIQVLQAASPALRMAALGLMRSQQAKIMKLQAEVSTTEADINQTDKLATALRAEHLTPGRVRGMEARIKGQLRYVAQCKKAIAALEQGFVPIPYLDFSPTEHWQVKRVPFRVLKAIEEGGLKEGFDELGIVEPQNETLREMEFTEVNGDRRTVTKVIGRVSHRDEFYIRDKDPMLIGRIRVGKRDQWFMIGVWNDWLSQL